MDPNTTIEKGESSGMSKPGSVADAGKPLKPKLVECINMASQKSFKQPSIFRVPEHLRKLNENAYTPCHVSIGPFHHKDDRYSLMEEHKLVYARSLILRLRHHRLANPSVHREDRNEGEIDEEDMKAFDVVGDLEDAARRSYAEKIKLNIDEFVNMLLIDGCFIVEFLCRKIRKLSYMENEATLTGETFNGMYGFIKREYEEWEPASDFIFQSTRTSFEVRRDLTLLENQLPYFVLEKLFELAFPGSNVKFHEIVYCALRTSIPNTTHVLTSKEVEDRVNNEPEMTAHFVSFLRMCCCSQPATADVANQEEHQLNNNNNIAHVLNGDDVENQVINEPRIMTTRFVSFLRMCCRPEPPTANVANNQEEHSRHQVGLGRVEFPCLCGMETPHDIRVPNATRLAKAGILFKKASTNTALLDIEFERGVLTMPPLTIWHHTEMFFRNVMAHELYNHTGNSRSKSVSDYMCFMDDLIHSKEDVALLVQSGIIQNWLESDQVIADLFNSVTKHILADYSSYSDTCKQLNDYRTRYNLRWFKAILQQEYFSQPWAIVYFIAFVIIQTTASIIQTVRSFNDSDN